MNLDSLLLQIANLIDEYESTTNNEELVFCKLTFSQQSQPKTIFSYDGEKFTQVSE